MSASPKADPLAALQALSKQEASRRAAQREANRARWPWLAEITDKYPEAKVLQVIDEDGTSIGRIPPDPPNWVTVDACNFFEMARLHEAMNPRNRK